MTYIPSSMLCDNKECRHPLSKHDGEEVTIALLKSRTFPCLYYDADGMTFAVCACRDFELPALGSEGKAAETPDEPVRTVPIDAETFFTLWLSGRVTWEPR